MRSGMRTITEGSDPVPFWFRLLLDNAVPIIGLRSAKISTLWFEV